jgi:hypothetical protein
MKKENILERRDELLKLKDQIDSKACRNLESVMGYIDARLSELKGTLE